MVDLKPILRLENENLRKALLELMDATIGVLRCVDEYNGYRRGEGGV